VAMGTGAPRSYASQDTLRNRTFGGLSPRSRNLGRDHLTNIPTGWYGAVEECPSIRKAWPKPIVDRRRYANMNTLLITTQIVCYGVGTVSAWLIMAAFVRRSGKWSRLRSGRPTTDQLLDMIVARKED